MGLIILALLGGLSTYLLSRVPSIGTIRASSITTIMCFLIFYGFWGIDIANQYSAIFFGGSFVGMSSPTKLSLSAVVVASGVFGVISAFLLPILAGLGGALGICAFLSVVLVYGSKYLYKQCQERNNSAR
ncbi:hypothetical protein D210916BOD24_21260 [Alteromonas sp. D210916BOD_24]|uniref:hypothetical protein n=1 Tax=Alteromonas sp. D210916BOD_24 TaxID=3157618 RepID=UPI00399C7F6A